MGRPARIHYAGAIYHAMSRGVDGCAIFSDDSDRRRFLDGMRRMERESKIEVLAYCLMGNHFHLALRVSKITLASAMHRLLTGYATAYNRRSGRTGHLFQARYKAYLCLDERYLAALIPYIHMNPVRAGLVAAPQDWPWSSFRPGVDSIACATEFDPWPSGTEEVEMAHRFEFERPDLEAIGAALLVKTGVKAVELRSRRKKWCLVAARRQFVCEALRQGHAQVDVARWLNTTKSSVSRYACESNGITGGLAPT